MLFMTYSSRRYPLSPVFCVEPAHSRLLLDAQPLVCALRGAVAVSVHKECAHLVSPVTQLENLHKEMKTCTDCMLYV